jgi:sulfoxide reductase heme-binding subunit YedZ
MTMWYLIRSLGLVSYLAFSVSLALGSASAVGAVSPRGIDRRLVRQLVHRSAAVLGLITLLGHIGLAVLDTYVHTPLTAVLVPLTSPYQPLALGFGSLAMYAFVLAAVTGWARRATASLLPERSWRWLHASAYVGWALCLTHGLTAGPDAGHRWAQLTYFLGVLVVALGLGVRLLAVPRRPLQRMPDGTFRRNAHSLAARTLPARAVSTRPMPARAGPTKVTR